MASDGLSFEREPTGSVIGLAQHGELTADESSRDKKNNVKIASLISEGEILRSRNKVQDALVIFEQVLSVDPHNIRALLYKGTCHKQLKDNEKAMEAFTQVLEIDSHDWCAHNNRGLIFKEHGELLKAQAEYQLAIQYGPKNSIAYANMAVVLTDLGSHLKMSGEIEPAIDKYREAIAHSPTYAPAYFNMGVVFSENERLVEALKYYLMAVEHNPVYVEALSNIGVIYKNSGKLVQAIEYYERALQANPNFTIANNNIAIALTDMGTQRKTEGHVLDGIRFYKKALVHNSKYPPAWYNLGVAHAELGNIDEAIVCYEMAVNFNPKCAEAYNNLGVIYKDKGNLDKSIFYYQEALKANPLFAQTLNNLGVIFTMLGKLDDAYSYCEKAIRANPAYAEAYNNLGVLYRDEGRIIEAIDSYDRCLALDPGSRNAGQNRLLALNSIPDDTVEPDFVFNDHYKWGARFCKEFKTFKAWDNDKRTDRVLRIGYLSADFFTHSVSYFIEAPLAFRNPQKTHVTCYSNVVRRDAKTLHLQKFADQWRSVYGLNAMEVADMIRKDQIDILVELTGHTAGNRLDVMALQPAPVQVTWIGYPNTTGLPTIHYRITDAIVDPPETKQKFSEELVRLPTAFLCYTPPMDAPPVSKAPAIANGFVTFGSFNNLAKVNDRVIRVWCAILKAVPNSRLLMKCKPFASSTIRRKFLKRFRDQGIESKRVDLVPLLPTTSEHLQSYSMVDISVDTFPYAGTTTTCESLFMGVPVVTLKPKGFNHAQSVGVTLMSRIEGAQKLITTTEEQYVQVASKLAKNIPRLQELRQSIRQNMLKSTLCDGKSFVANLENLYADMWRRYTLGQNGHGSVVEL